MRQSPDLRSGLLCALLCGGWVCQSSAENRCPGAVTCDIEIANVCCPFGSTAWCGACTSDSEGCPSEIRACTDLARVLECSFSAKITTARCSGRSSGPAGTELWTLEVSGLLTGCGEEVAFISVDNNQIEGECGSWDSGVFGGCIPPDDDLSSTHWSLVRTIARDPQDTAPVEVLVSRGHADVTLTTASIECAP